MRLEAPSNRYHPAAAFLAAGLLMAAPVWAAGPPSTPVEVSVMMEGGHYVFRDDAGLALYSSAADRVGKSNCIGRCAEIWPPLLAPQDAKPVADWTTIDRGGARQWSYRGMPVYTHRGGATAPTGDGWREIKP